MNARSVHLWVLRTQWELRRVAVRATRRCSPVTWATSAMVLLAAVLAVWAWRLSIAAADLHTAIQELQSKAALPAETAQPVALTAADIEAALPSEDSPAQIVQQLIALARREELTLNAGEYKLADNSRAGVKTYRMRLPMSGDAAAIQRFVMQAVNEHRTLGVESLQMRRERVEATDVEASVQFVLVTSAATVRSSGARLP